MGVDIDEPGLDLRDPVRIVRGLGFAQQRIALEIGLEHDLDQAFRPVGRFLREAADAPARRQGDAAGFGGELAADRAKQRRFAGAVAADQADARTGRDLHRGVVDQEPAGEPDRDVGDGQHARVVTAAAAKGNRFCERSRRRRLPSISRSRRCERTMKLGLRLCCSRSPTASQIERLVLRSHLLAVLGFEAGHGRVPSGFHCIHLWSKTRSTGIVSGPAGLQVNSVKFA